MEPAEFHLKIFSKDPFHLHGLDYKSDEIVIEFFQHLILADRSNSLSMKI